MPMLSRLRNFFLLPRKPRKRASPLQVQALEDRWLLSGLTLLGQWNGGTPRYSDGWVWDHYAFIAHYRVNGGVHILDIADPTKPVEIATFFSPSGFNDFRDLQVHNGILYASSDSGGGLVIADVSDPYNPYEISRITAADGGFNSVHTFFVDSPYLYQADSRTRVMHAFDVSDPYSPRHVRTFSSVIGDAVHEVTVKDGRLYTAGIWGVSTAEIYDVSDIENGVTRLGVTPVGRPMAHTTWPTDDHQYMAVATESQQGDLSFWDISDPSNPQELWRLEMPIEEAWCVHQVWIQGDLLFASWYQAGVFAFDISDRANPVLLGQYDTFDGEIDLAFPYQGAWGVFPFTLQDDGYQYVAAFDLQSGVFLFRLDLESPSPAPGPGVPTITRFAGTGSRAVLGFDAGGEIVRVHAGVLDVILSAGDDTVSVTRNQAAGTLEVTINNGRSYSFASSQVQSVTVRGLEGNDRFFLDPELNLPTSVDGGPGWDLVTGWPRQAPFTGNPEAHGIHRIKGGDYVRVAVEETEESKQTLPPSAVHLAMSMLHTNRLTADSVDSASSNHAVQAVALSPSPHAALLAARIHEGLIPKGDWVHWREAPNFVKWHAPG